MYNEALGVEIPGKFSFDTDVQMLLLYAVVAISQFNKKHPLISSYKELMNMDLYRQTGMTTRFIERIKFALSKDKHVAVVVPNHKVNSFLERKLADQEVIYIVCDSYRTLKSIYEKVTDCEIFVEPYVFAKIAEDL